MTSGYTLPAMPQAISDPRFAPYLREAGGDEKAALELYTWSTRIASAAYELVAHVEVFMRNAIDRALSHGYQDEACGIPWLLREPPLQEEAMRRVTDVRHRLRGQHRESRHQIVAGLSFGFWASMLGRKYEEEWRGSLRHAFPGGNGTRKEAAALVEAIRKFRNRLAQHDSVLGLDIPFEVQRVHALSKLLGSEPAAWLRSVDRTADVYRERPVATVDTVVVAAKHAWPLYEQERAYVCQAGRWFRPVTRLAFYTDQEIKADVPLIRHRRDNVVWTEEHAVELSAGDREDRKIAAVIRASRSREWTEGVYQVFLLTRPGDSDHRVLPHALPHRTSGRGSAYTQRQRYVSLHALETAATTDDLIRAT
ncbi:hypothetical protein J2X28_000426 [Kocuria rhizophila]|uniref:hypothetical protein n=1 Tax=Kocuria rhizophila TaxID=72000 RepID=UPI002856C074|nr:hypothetical protein [Kocuria rhizophila]MDR7373470.1 hypothetical protein [Kocuria rhizophila]WSY87890.1 hypothetical protein OH783_09545 [Kocuria rhizophila]WSZ53316.1 hypothetical protein OG926_09580 [Kocuria rhizophila]